MPWWHELIAAGAVPAAFTPPPTLTPGTDGAGGTEHADLVEDAELEAHPLPGRSVARLPEAVSFLAGIERWSVVAYDGVVQVVNAYVAAAIRRRDERGLLRTTRERHRGFAIAPLERMKPGLRQWLALAAPDLESVRPGRGGQPPRHLGPGEGTGGAPRGARR